MRREGEQEREWERAGEKNVGGLWTTHRTEGRVVLRGNFGEHRLLKPIESFYSLASRLHGERTQIV